MNRLEKLPKPVKELLEEVKKYNPEKVILFGSYAKGKVDKYSDVDLLVIKKTKKPFLNRLKEIALLVEKPIPFDIFVYTPSEFATMKKNNFSFIREVLRNGKIIYE